MEASLEESFHYYINIHKLSGFNKFLSQILCFRNSSTALHAFKFYRHGHRKTHPLKRIVKYAVSHNVKQLQLSIASDIQNIMPSIVSCRTLASLTLLSKNIHYRDPPVVFPSSLNLPALTTLHLQYFVFPAGSDGIANPFSTLNKLNSLTIVNCGVVDTEWLCISSRMLDNLTIHIQGHYKHEKNCKIELSAPNLHSFTFIGNPIQKIFVSNLSSIEQVNVEAIFRFGLGWESPLPLLTWLLNLANIKSLTVSTSTLEIISLVPRISKAKHSSLCNLKSLKVKMKSDSYRSSMMILRDVKLEQAAAKSWRECAKFREAIKTGFGPASISDRIMDYLLQNSPSAKIDIIEDSSKFCVRSFITKMYFNS